MPTLSELLALPAGRELDCAVFEILHADGFASGEYSKRVYSEYVRPGGYEEKIDYRKANGDRMNRVSPDWFSTQWASAGPLLEEMLAAGFVVKMWVSIMPPCFVFECEGRTFFVDALTDAPLAIVRAYCAWKLGGKDER